MTPLESVLRERIRLEGPLSFREVMQAALYHPCFGYYTNLRGFGAEGDFITSPECHPAFGWLLGRQALDVWQAVGQPRPFRVLELGAGSGALAAALVDNLNGSIPEITYTIDELSPTLRGKQRQHLRDPAFRWDGAHEPAHFIIANEVADALPVCRVVMRRGRLRELKVDLDADARLVFVETDEAPASVDAYFEALHYQLPEGHLADVCTDLADWVERLVARLEPRGVALVLDYAASPPRDSLLTYFRHTLGSDPLVRLGEQDLSAHVDMRTLVRLAIAHGLKGGAIAQSGLLLNLGFQQVHARLASPADRQALAQLVDPAGLGGQITAVFLLRGLPAYRPVGAVGGRDWPEPSSLPALPPGPAAEDDDFLSQWREAFPAQTDDA